MLFRSLIDGLKDGTIDCIASHHRPQEWDAKAKEFEYASDGMNVQEIAFSIAWNAVKGLVPLERVVDALTKGGKIFGLEQQTVNKGAKAELTIFTTEETVIPQKEHKKSIAANHPFFGKELAGKVIGIITK